MTYFCMMKSPRSPHNGKVGRMIQNEKGGWVKLCFGPDTMQQFKKKNLE